MPTGAGAGGLEVVDHLFAGVPVSDRARFAWYERLVGRPADLVPHENEVAWQLRDRAWIAVYVDPETAGATVHTVLVADLDATLARLRAGGIGTPPVELLGSGARQCVLRDEDGNRLKVAAPAASQ